MRSDFLKQQPALKESYKDFFSQYDLIISLPHIFRRSSTTKLGENSILMWQKLGTKMYLGITLNTYWKWLKLSSVSSYNSRKKEFSVLDWVTLMSDEKMSSFEKIWWDVLEDYGVKWSVEIGILSEHMRGHWFWFMWSVCTLVSAAVHILAKKITTEFTNENYEQTLTQDNIDSIIALSLWADRQWWWTPLWLLPNASLLRIRNSIVQFWSPIVERAWKTEFNLKQWVHKVLSLANVSGASDEEVDAMPFDYWIISFWVAYDSWEIRRKYKHFDKFYSETYDFFIELKNTLDLPGDQFTWSSAWIIELSRFFRINILKYWKKIIQNPSETYYADAFIQSLSDHWVYDSILESERSNMLDMYYRFRKIKSFPGERIGIIPISTSKVWGTFLFVCHRNQSRDTMMNLMDKLREEWYEMGNLEYLSRRDWVSDDGLMVHQHITQWIYSHYVKQWSVLFKSWKGTQYIWNHREILWNEKEWIILDSVYKKIYLNWERLTHKDVRSQSATVEILELLCSRKGEYVHNSEFCASSYSKNKNEMIGKIIVPLVSLLKKRFDVEVEIECKWSIFDFHVMLEDDKWVINRLLPLHT